MKRKKQANKKMPSTSKSKKEAAADTQSEQKLNIPKRSIIVSTDDDPKEAPSSDAKQVKTKREAKKIEPQSDPTKEEAGSDPEPKPEPKHETAESKQHDSASEQKNVAKKDDTDEPTDDAPQSEETQNPEDTPHKDQSHPPKVFKNAKREQEIQNYIEDRKFFVPINSVARKRSIKISIALTFLELLLGLFLLNLMLDAGLIQLLEKIPHTNFFDLQ